MIKPVHYLFRNISGRAWKVERDQIRESISVHRGRSVRHNSSPQYLRVIRNGNFRRIRIPQTKTRSRGQSDIPYVTATTETEKTMSRGRLLWNWMTSNMAVMTLNIGSICILIGFSRSDVLELRTLTMTGQLTFAIYNLAQTNILWPSVIWSTLFASVNAWKISNTYQERNAEVHMNKEQEAIYVSYFMNHGIAPLQFRWIEENSETRNIKKGDAIIHKGAVVDRIFLVVHGSTHAHVDGKRFTAASSTPETRGDQLEGGDSGAWIGDLAFLDWQGRQSGSELTPMGNSSIQNKERRLSMYTITADEDSKIMVWTYERMEELMETSPDMRAAVVRAITAAVVGKFVNLTIQDINSSRSHSRWVSWLRHWSSGGDRSQIKIGSADVQPSR